MVPRRCILMTLASLRIFLWHYHVQSGHESFVCKLIRKLLSFSLDLLPHLVNYGPIQSEMDNKAGYALWHFYLERLTPHRDLGIVFQLLSKYGHFWLTEMVTANRPILRLQNGSPNTNGWCNSGFVQYFGLWPNDNSIYLIFLETWAMLLPLVIWNF